MMQLALPGLPVLVRPRQRSRRVADLARELAVLRDEMGRLEQRRVGEATILRGQIEDLRYRVRDLERMVGAADIGRAPRRRAWQ